MSKNQSLSLRTQWLGARLKAARQAANLTLKEAADQLQLADTTLSRFEKGAIRVRRPYVTEMIDYYSISDSREREALKRLNDDAWRKDWWDGDTSDLEMGFLDFTWLESRASHICSFEPMIVHGLLQTQTYAEAVMTYSLGPDATPESVSRLADIRRARQRILSGDDPKKLTLITEESALRRPIGGAKTLAEQLAHAINLARQSHIEIRVLARDAEWNPGHTGPFTYFEMPDPYPEVAYLENLSGRTFLEENDKVARIRRTYDELYRLSLGPQETVSLMRKIFKELE